jgi:hypothetical protein
MLSAASCCFQSIQCSEYLESVEPMVFDDA